MWNKFRIFLEKYYRFFGVVAAGLGFLIWILETGFVKDSEGKVAAIQKYAVDLITIHEFWDLKQKFQQQAIDQGRAYNRLGKLLGGTEGLQKYDDEMGRILLVNSIKKDAMMSAINISELTKGVLEVVGPQHRLDSLSKATVKSYNAYADSINQVKFEVSDLRNIPDSSIQKLELVKKINVAYRDIFKSHGQQIMNEAERIKDSLEKEKVKIASNISIAKKTIGTLFVLMSAATILGSLFEARKK